MTKFDSQELGVFKLSSAGHDEIHSLYKNIPANRIEFWMGFGEQHFSIFRTLNQLGLLSSKPIQQVCQPSPQRFAFLKETGMLGEW